MAAGDAPPRAQRVRGTQDIFGEDAARFERVVEAFGKVRRLFGFKPVHVPVFEFTHVFARSLGETSDVVGKEMYSFEDRGGESLTLRPEFTAGIARAYISEGWKQHGVLKLAAHGPVFRYERPQKGRYRQFHQLDAEILGAAEPMADVEAISFAAMLLEELKIEGVTLKLNTLGDAQTRAAWRAALVAHFEARRDELSEDSLARLAKNPMRILDSKAPQDRPAAESAPGIDAFLSAEAGRFFESVTRGLDASGVAWERDTRLVRGLDYYRHTAFEFVTDRLGAQGTVLAGGRYDGLVEALGGPPTPGVGWAAGVERLGLLLGLVGTGDWIFTIVSDWEESDTFALSLAQTLRRSGQMVDLIYSGSRNSKFQKAAARNVSVVIQVSDLDPFLANLVFPSGVGNFEALFQIKVAVRKSFGQDAGAVVRNAFAKDYDIIDLGRVVLPSGSESAQKTLPDFLLRCRVNS